MNSTAICIVVENLPVPLDRRVWREACALRDAGYRVSVVCPKGTGHMAKAYECLEEIEIYRHNSWEATSIVGYFLEYGVSIAAEFLLTLKVFAKTRFRILQACNPPDTIFLIAVLLRMFGVRFIFDQHDLCPELFESKFGGRAWPLYYLVRLAEFCSYRAADVCIATNESFKRIAVERGGKRPEDVYVVRNCPPLKLQQTSNARSDKFGQKYLVTYVGFMGKQDGLDLLVEAIDEIIHRQGRTDTHFLLVGDGTVASEVRNSLTAKRLDSYVTMTGRIPHKDVCAHLAQTDVGVVPDPKNPMNDNSTLIKIFEYMAFRIPTVMFDLREGRNIAADSALYATSNDPRDFADKVVMLLNDPELRGRLGSLGRNRIEQSLHWDNEKLSLVKAYQAAGQLRSARVRRQKASI
jgi:glycosyltransferase involved in cell wall biosynthesis